MTKEERRVLNDRRGLHHYARSLYGSNLTEEQIKERMLVAKALIDRDKK
jgi:hypothetical protein